MSKVYAGIGSRRLPKSVYDFFVLLGKELALDGWTLRSGAADGADSAFEEGCDLANGNKEIYLPWAGFNGNGSEHYEQPKRAFEIAEQYHPSWKRLPKVERHFHARNVQQVLGELVYEPCDCIICWTPDGAEIETTVDTGGTGQAIRIANGYNIPVFNFANDNAVERLNNFLLEKEKEDEY